MTSRILLPGFLGGLLAAALHAQDASLANELPADTLFYFQIPDVQAFIQSGDGSTIGRIYRDPAVQDFSSGLVSLVRNGWGEMRQQAGAMGLPEGLTHWDALTSLEVGAALGAGSFTGNDYEPSIVVGVSLGLKGDLAQQTFNFLSQMGPQHSNVKLEDTPEGKVLVVHFEGDEKFEVHVRGNHLMGWSKIGSFPGGTLAASPKFTQARHELGMAGSSFLYFDCMGALSAMVDMVRHQNAQAGAMMDHAFAQFGVGSLAYIAAANGWHDGASYSKSIVQLSNSPTPMFPADGPRVDRELLQYVPSSAVSFSLFTTDLDHVYDGVHGMWTDLKALEVQPGQTLGSMWDGFQPGHPLYEWLEGGKSELLAKGLKGFGAQGFSYSLPSQGGLMSGSSGGGTFLRLDDPAAVRDLLAGVVPEIAALVNANKQIPIEIEVKTIKITEKGADGVTVSKDGPQYYSLKIQGNELPAQFRQASMFLGQLQPTFGVSVDGWFISGMNRLTVSGALKKGLSKAESDIRTKEDVKAFVERVPQNAVSLSWSDPRPGISQTVSMVQGLLPMVSGSIPPNMLPVDLNKFPGPDSFVKYMRPSESFSVVEGNRMVSQSVGSFNFADFLYCGGVALSVIPPFAMKFMNHGAPPGGPQGPAEAPAPGAQPATPQSAPEHGTAADSQQRTAMEELDRLTTGLVVYRDEYRRYPASLADLVKPTDTWKYGFLPERKSEPKHGLVPDPWGHGYVYRQTGDAYVLYSPGPNGVDDGGTGDDVHLVE